MKLLDWIPLEKLDWQRLSTNPSPGAIELLEKNIVKIDWYCLTKNPSAINLLKKNPDKICWEHLSKHPGAISYLNRTLIK